MIGGWILHLLKYIKYVKTYNLDNLDKQITRSFFIIL